MRRLLLLIVAGCIPGLIPAVGWGQPPGDYRVELIPPTRVAPREQDGKKSLWVTVRFKVTHADGTLATDVAKEELVVEEDGRRVRDLVIDAPGIQEPLTVMLAIDISGSMDKGGKLEQAKRAARSFLDRLHPKVDCGLILFDHEIRVREPPAGKPGNVPEHRNKLRQHIDATRPGGGTAYIDAGYAAVEMLREVKGRRVVLLLTDGVDIASNHTLKQLTVAAALSEVRVYTLGVGEPGKNEQVTTVLVLDHSGSMAEPAGDGEDTTKMEALKVAASRFVDLMRPGVRTTLLPFSSRVARPEPFTDDKERLKAGIQGLRPLGGTRLYDAAHDAAATLDAEGPAGKRAVVVLTDGMDEGSRRRVEDVLNRSRGAHTPLHMLALGRPREVNEEVMRLMASESGGTYHHAGNQQRLVDVFEALSIQLHDDGIDEASLKELADATGGKYIPARDASKLHLIYQDLAEELQTTWTVAFPSQRPSDDGTARAIDISIWRNGVRVSEVARADYQRPGVVVAEMHPAVYLVMLGGLACLLAVPPGIRRLYRFYGGT